LVFRPQGRRDDLVTGIGTATSISTQKRRMFLVVSGEEKSRFGMRFFAPRQMIHRAAAGFVAGIGLFGLEWNRIVRRSGEKLFGKKTQGVTEIRRGFDPEKNRDAPPATEHDVIPKDNRCFLGCSL
jgi:hypothetical protein